MVHARGHGASGAIWTHATGGVGARHPRARSPASSPLHRVDFWDRFVGSTRPARSFLHITHSAASQRPLRSPLQKPPVTSSSTSAPTRWGCVTNWSPDLGPVRGQRPTLLTRCTAFRYFRRPRDLTAFRRTAPKNPPTHERAATIIIEAKTRLFSVVLQSVVQKYLHDLPGWHRLATENPVKGSSVGRTNLDNIEA